MRPGRILGILALLTGLALAPAPALAADIAAGVRAGTLGLGVELTGSVSDRLNIRGSFNTASVSGSVEEGGIDYDGDVDLQSFGVLVDFHPFEGKFRLSGGLYSNGNEIGITATPTVPITIGGTTYNPSDVGTLSGKVDFSSSAAYVGVGTGDATRGFVSFVFDAGVFLQGSPSVSLASSNGLVSAADLENERRQIEDDISGFRYWPVVSFGVAFSF